MVAWPSYLFCRSISLILESEPFSNKYDTNERFDLKSPKVLSK